MLLRYEREDRFVDGRITLNWSYLNSFEFADCIHVAERRYQRRWNGSCEHSKHSSYKQGGKFLDYFNEC